MSRTLRFLGVSALALVGYASAVLIPEAQSVRVTKKPADVVECKVMGNVGASPPFNSPSDPETKLRNAGAVAGGNVVLQTSGANILGKDWTGVAYLCPTPSVPAPSPTPRG
jgi:hypothetical protein